MGNRNFIINVDLPINPPRERTMRVLFGMVLGAALTVGAAYIYDSVQAPAAPSVATSERVAAPAASRPLVNWDVVSRHAHAVKGDLQAMTAWLRAEWTKRTAG